MNTKEWINWIIKYNDWLWEHNWKYRFGSEKWEQWGREK